MARNPEINIHALRDLCEQQIDRTTLGEFLETIVMDICFQKAEHLLHHHHDEDAAGQWDKCASILNAAITDPAFSRC